MVIRKIFNNNTEYKSSGCIEWVGTLNKSGYGVLGHKLAHRISFELFNRYIDKRCVCHICDNPRCVNPLHLFLGSRADNRRDCVDKDRQAKGERIAISKLTSEDVVNIRYAYEHGIVMAKLAKQYGMSLMAISKLLNRETWRHVGSEKINGKKD